MDQNTLRAKTREKWAELSMDVWRRFKVRVGMPESIVFVSNSSFLAKVWSSPLHVEKLEINIKSLLPENESYFFKVTLVHEFVHCFDNAKNGKSSGHGPAWKTLMCVMGAKPERCGAWPTDRKGMKPVCNDTNLINLDDY